ncbi:MAG: cytochrome b/b6 domain-containing protein [Caulobacteraceae bacterium]
MTTDIQAAPMRPAAGPRRDTIYRHAFLVRLTHWVNALAIFVLIGSGLNIFNAYPRLNWGKKGDMFDHAWASLDAVQTAAGMRGVTTVGPFHFDTTGFLGWSKADGDFTARGWPQWLTIPGSQDLADARHWHFFFAWVLAINALIYLVWSLSSRHIQRDLWPTGGDVKSIPRSILDHLRLRHPVGEAAKRYNVLQRFAYLALILLVAGMIFTGLTMSPGFNAFAPWMLDILGGRQSARSLHFIFASLVVAFIVVHLIEVVLAGPINEIRSIVTGRYAVPREHGR